MSLAVWLIARSAAAEVTVAAEPVERYRLPNGLNVILERDRRQPRVAVVVGYGVGERHEPRGYAGIAHLVEHLTYRGSRHVPPLAAMSLLEGAGAAEVNAGTGKDGSYYFTVLPAQQLELVLWIESDRMAFLLEKIDERSLALEKRVVAGELLQRRTPGRLFELHIDRLLYPKGHPYAPSLIEEQEVAAIELPHVQWFFQQTYRPDNAALTIVGDFDAEAAKRLVSKYFGAVAHPRGRPLSRGASELVVTGQQESIIALPYDRERMALVFPAPAPNAPDEASVELLAAIAGDGRLSRLWRSGVDGGLAKDISASLSHLELASWLSVDAELTRNAPPRQLLEVVDRELDRLSRELVPEGELALVKQAAIADIVSAHEQLLIRALALAVTAQSRRMPLYDPNFAIARISRVTAAQVQSAARRVLRKDRRLVAFTRTDPTAPPVGVVSASEGHLYR